MGYDDRVVIPGLMGQLSLALGVEGIGDKRGWYSATEIDLSIYDYVVVCLSGGKDSLACLLHLLDLGVERSRIEVWHHEVDGREGSTLMDWPCVPDYCAKVAAAFEVPIYYSWLEGGFEGEMTKEASYSRPHRVETPEGLLVLERERRGVKPQTRLKFPQVTANLQTRWCSSALKIDVGRRALTNQERFLEKKTLFVTGERRQESANRARYYQLERHICDCRDGRKRRYVDAWRPVLEWDEHRVWDTLRRHGVIPPVPYRLGWGRSSCMKCIFNSGEIWATLYHYFPGSLDRIAAYERQFGCTINREQLNVIEIARRHKPLPINDEEALKQAMERAYTLPIIDREREWVLPPGAFKNYACGPT